MSTEVQEDPVREVADEDNLDHFVCCDPNRALCGADVSDHDPETFEGPDGPDDCVVCLNLIDAPCSAPMCTVRSWFRHRWGRWSR